MDAHGSSSSDTGKKSRNHWTKEQATALQQATAGLRDTSDGAINWAEVARSVPNRTGKQCREKWRNDLRPNISKSAWSSREEYAVCRVHCQVGNQWADIARYLPGRTENTIKNHYNATLRSKAEAKPPSLLWVYGRQVLANGGATSIEVFDRAVQAYSSMGHAEPLQRYAAEDEGLRVGASARACGGGTAGGTRQALARAAVARRPRKKHRRRGSASPEETTETEEEEEQDVPSCSSASDGEGAAAAASRGRAPAAAARGGEGGELLAAVLGADGNPVAARGRHHHQVVRHGPAGKSPTAPHRGAGSAAVASRPVPAAVAAAGQVGADAAAAECVEVAAAASSAPPRGKVAEGDCSGAHGPQGEPGCVALQCPISAEPCPARPGGNGAEQEVQPQPQEPLQQREQQQQQLPLQLAVGAAPCVVPGGDAEGRESLQQQQQQQQPPAEQPQRPWSLRLPVVEDDDGLGSGGGEGCLVAAVAVGGGDTPLLLSPTDRLEAAFVSMPEGPELAELLADINCDTAAAVASEPGESSRGEGEGGEPGGGGGAPPAEQAPAPPWTSAQQRAYDAHRQSTRAPEPGLHPYGSLVEALLLQGQPQLAVRGRAACPFIHQPHARQGGPLSPHSLLAYLQLQVAMLGHAAAGGTLQGPGPASALPGTLPHLHQQSSLAPLMGVGPLSAAALRALYDMDLVADAHSLASSRAGALKQAALGVLPLPFTSSPPVRMVPVSQGGVNGNRGN